MGDLFVGRAVLDDPPMASTETTEPKPQPLLHSAGAVLFGRWERLAPSPCWVLDGSANTTRNLAFGARHDRGRGTVRCDRRCDDVELTSLFSMVAYAAFSIRSM
jgi:hypothetical protein